MTPRSEALGRVQRHRRPLYRSVRALAARALTVGFLGGSITAPKTGTRWPEPFASWLCLRYPGVRVKIENAALGATGSDLGSFRAGPEIIDRHCDLVFVEYAVNDIDHPAVQRRRSREGLIRQLLAAGCDVVLVYAFCPEMLPAMESGQVPASIEEFELLAAHYELGSVWMGLAAWREVLSGLMSWQDWLPDGLHPEVRGSFSYAQSVIAFCEEEWGAAPGTAPSRSEIPPPVTSACWEEVELIPLSNPTQTGPWTLQRWFTCLGMPQVLRTTVPGAGLTLSFSGRGLVLGFDFGRLSGEVRYRLDRGAWTTTERDRPAWCGDNGWFRTIVVADDLPQRHHLLELETLVAPIQQGGGAVTTIGLIGAIR